MWNVASHDFHNFSVNSGKLMATVLVSTRERCRMCMKILAVDPNTHVVVIYHEQWQLSWFTSNQMLSYL